VQDSISITDTAFDILSLEALFMVPRRVLAVHRFGIDIDYSSEFAPS
jgi:hypothetical protein